MQNPLKLNHIYCESNLETMARMPDNFVDLTVTSPPYDNLRTYNGYSFDFENVAKELFRVTKEGGVVVWVVNDSTIKGSETGTSFKQALFFMECGFNLHDTMIFKKRNPAPQIFKKRYQSCFEYMFVFSKGYPKTMNPIMVKCETNRTSAASCGIKNKKGEVARNKKFKRVNKEKIKHNIFEYKVGNLKESWNNSLHPATFPQQLADDHIISWSNENDIVYDPFNGSGTTSKMALKNNRKYIGSEISQEYVDIAEARIKEYLHQPIFF